MNSMVKDVFGAADYVVFALVLLVSAAIGIFYAVLDRKKTNTRDFLLAERSMSVFPVAMSILATSMSAITLLGTPAEIYQYGTQYIMILVAFCMVVPATAYLYMPVYYNLGITSAYQYLELRFHKCVRTIGSGIFIMHMLMYMPVVLYAPALALSEVTGFSVWLAVLLIGLVCTFYTSIGGIKAVVWTDLFQAILMYVSIILVLVKGAIDVGGMTEVWQKAFDGDRVELFNFDVDPLVRHTFWALAIGGYVTWAGQFAASQAMIQRYLTVKSLKGAQTAVWINLPLLFILIGVTSLNGLVIYAYYADCDPIGTKAIQSADQLFPRFVMETLRSLPGLPGLFVSGIFSGSLSTISSGVNALSAVTLEDFIKAYMVKDLSEIWGTRITKILGVGYGLLAIALVCVAEQLGGVLQAALTFHGIIGGPMLGIFTLGMFFPFANTWGACTGLASGLGVSMWLGMGAFASKPRIPKSPMSYEACSDLYRNVTGTLYDNVAILHDVQAYNEEIFPPFRVSYLWLSALGFVLVIVVGILVSLLSGSTKGSDIDDRLLSPFALFFRSRWPFGTSRKMVLPGGKTSSLSTIATSCGDSELYLSKSQSKK